MVRVRVRAAGEGVELDGETFLNAFISQPTPGRADGRRPVALQKERHAIRSITRAVHAKHEAAAEGRSFTDRNGSAEESGPRLGAGVGRQDEHTTSHSGIAIQLKT